MHRAHLWLRCTAKLSTVDVPDPFDLQEFCRGLSDSRGRRIELVPTYSRAAALRACLPWLQSADTDYVLHEQNASPSQRDYLALHAIAHLLFEHHGTAVPTDALAAHAAPHLDPVVLHRALGPTIFVAGRRAEAEAHLLARLMLHPRCIRHQPRQVPQHVPARRRRPGREARVGGR